MKSVLKCNTTYLYRHVCGGVSVCVWHVYMYMYIRVHIYTKIFQMTLKYEVFLLEMMPLIASVWFSFQRDNVWFYIWWCEIMDGVWRMTWCLWWHPKVGRFTAASPFTWRLNVQGGFSSVDRLDLGVSVTSTKMLGWSCN